MTMIAISTDNLEYFTISFNTLEGIMLNDFESFILFYKDWRKQTRKMTRYQMN